MEEEIYMNIDLRGYEDSKIIEAKGKHYFKAFRDSKGETSEMIISLITQLVIVDGQKMTRQMIDDTPLDEISYLTEVISTMMNKKYTDGI